MLCAALRRHFGAPFEDLTEQHCIDALGGLGRTGRRRLTFVGVAAELILAVGAWGYAPKSSRDRNQLLKHLDRARSRGRRKRSSIEGGVT
jgi:hypothetical protein